MKKSTLPKFTLFFRKPKKLDATTVSRRAPSSESYYNEEPKTNLSSAFVVVLVLHIVAVGGIYAFNSLRTSRAPVDSHSSPPGASSVGTPLVPKINPAAQASETKPAPKPAAPAVVQDSRRAAFLASKTEEASGVSATASPQARTYTVAKGDTPTSIAKKFGTTSTDLLKLNKIDDPKKMQTGQPLKIPAKKN